MKQYESYKVLPDWRMPQRRETRKGAIALAERLHDKGIHGRVEGVWYDENGIHFDLIYRF